MARSRSKMHLRFRHSFPLVGHFLHFTVSKKGVSLNAHAGFFSKSWGTRGNTTTVDAPGHLGLFWRKQSKRTHASADEVATKHEHKWFHLSLALVVLVAIVEAWHIWVHPFSKVVIVGQPLNTLLILTGALAVAVLFLHHLGVASGIILFLLTLGGVYLQWRVFHSTAWNDVHPAMAAVVHHATAVPHAVIHHHHVAHHLPKPKK